MRVLKKITKYICIRIFFLTYLLFLYFHYDFYFSAPGVWNKLSKEEREYRWKQTLFIIESGLSYRRFSGQVYRKRRAEKKPVLPRREFDEMVREKWLEKNNYKNRP